MIAQRCAIIASVTAYQAYVKSNTWKRRKKRFAKSHERKCLCGEVESLDLHHRTYERLGDERDEDLMWLCRRCHRLVHQLVSEGQLDLSCEGFFSPGRARRSYQSETQRALIVKPWDKFEQRNREGLSDRAMRHRDKHPHLYA